MRIALLLSTLLLSITSAFAETVNVICKDSDSEFRLEITDGELSKLFYKTQAVHSWKDYQLEEVELDSNLSCNLKSVSPLVIDCQSENEYHLRGRSTGPEGVKKKIKASFTAISRTIIDETIEGKKTKSSNILSYTTDVGLGWQISPLKVKGIRIDGKDEVVFDIDLNRGIRAIAECRSL